MVDGLILEGFKAFGKRQHIPLAPITLIFGANSAGKSSIIQSLLLLRQSMDNVDAPEQPLLFKGEFVDLGSFRDSVFNHDTSRSIEISLTFNEPITRTTRSGIPSETNFKTGGLGIRYASSSQGEKVAVPIYFGDDIAPAIVLDRAKPSNDTDLRHFMKYQRGASSPASGDTEKTFKMSPYIESEHSLWQQWFEAYADRSIPAAQDVIEQLASRIDSVANHEENSDSGLRPNVELRILLEDLMPWLRSKRHVDPTNTDDILDSARDYFTEIRDVVQNYSYADFLKAVFGENDKTASAVMRNFSIQDLYLKRTDPIDQLLDGRSPFSAARLTNLPGWANLPLLPNVELLLAQLANVQRRFISGLRYLGPLRGYPERHYVAGGRSSASVGRLGESSADVLYANPTIASKVDEYIQRFGFGYRLRLSELVDKDQPDSHGGVFGVRLVDQATSVNVSLVDVGFGVSQVLPIIVQSLLSRDSTVAIEQPEIHLHPALQAELAELFADSIKEPINNRFIIETHSEHLILRFQKLIRRGLLSPDQLSVLYVSRPKGPEDEGATVSRIRLGHDGDFIDEWPGGFFEEGFREMFDL